jgi:transglutaminase-like putative cysteine protease
LPRRHNPLRSPRMIYTVRHVTRYEYGNPVDLGAHLLHLRPRALPWQRILHAHVTAIPAPARMDQDEDCFGNRVDWLYLDAPHPRFQVTLDAIVDVHAPSPPLPAGTPSWTQVAAAAKSPAGFDAAEFLFDSPLVATIAEARDYAEKSFPPERPILEALLDLNARIRRDFEFKAGVTTVSTPVRQVLAQRAGVCQDFSHLMIAGLRALGLPARYVSGYIRTYTPPGGKRHLGADQSHAWVGCWMGPAHGWVDLDPTNGLVVSDEHVVLGWGRDYTDTCPVRGVILGGGHHSVSAGVDLIPVDGQDAASLGLMGAAGPDGMRVASHE